MTINMTRHSGAVGLPVAECIDRHYNTWRVRTDMQPVYDEQDAEHQTGVSFIETEFPYKPSMAQVKDFVFSVINAQTDKKILSGFVWNNKPVWLSEENQKNFSEAQRIAVMSNGANLPIVFKLGEDEHGDPIYHEFTSTEELTQFYLAAVAYIQQCLTEGWQKKDSIDWNDYDINLN